MESDSKLRKIRGGHRSYVNKTLAKAKEMLADVEESTQGTSRHQLLQYKKTLTERMKVLSDLDDKILELLSEKQDESEDSIAKEVEEAGDLKEEIGKTIIAIEEMILPTCSLPSEIGSTEQIPEIPVLPVSPSTAKTPRVRLPKLELRKFDGKIHLWQEFWDNFESAIHKNEELSEIDKFTYLRGLLDGPAKEAIGGFSLTSVNYKEAYELLKNRYGKKMDIQRSHITELLNLQPVFNEKDSARLRTLYDRVEIHHRGLKAQGVEEKTYSSIVVPAVFEKLPQALRLTMTRGVSDYLEWSMSDMLKYLLVEVELREKHCGKPEKFNTGSQPWKGNTTTSALFAGKAEVKCVFCLESHPPEECKKVKNLQDRKNIVRKYGRCFICLRKNHIAKDCRSKAKCKTCSLETHHVSLCSGVKVERESVTGTHTHVGHLGTGGRVALQSAQGRVEGARRKGKIRLLFDSGSHKSFITERVAQRYGFTVVRKEWLDIKTFGNSVKQSGLREVVEVSVKSVKGGEVITLEAFVVPDISRIQNEHLEIVKKEYAHLRKLWLSDVRKNCEELEIELLVGADYMWRFLTGEVIRGGMEEPVAVQTALGWVLSGPLKVRPGEKVTSVTQVNLIVQGYTLADSLESNLHKLWDLESIGIREVDNVYEEFLDTTSFNGSRYSVKLPWKAGIDRLPTNYNNSRRRLKGLENKLRKEPELMKEYNAVIQEQLKSGVIEQVAELEGGNRVHYLPHHPVIRRDAETTKVRIVYDASSKGGKGSTSLNECLHVGPPLNPLLYNILLRFRMKRVALVADIEKAFLNIEIDRQDRDSLRFLWTEDILDPDSDIVVYRFNRVVFGLSASPFLLNGTMRFHLSQFEGHDPDFVRQMLESFYVDDLVSGERSVDLTLSLYQKSKERLAQGGFRLRKWLTNNKEVRNVIGAKEAETESIDTQVTQEESYAKATVGGPVASSVHKVLGMPWDCFDDKLQFTFAHICARADKSTPTKRNVLGLLAMMFDPLGLVSPVMVSMKIIFQELCRRKVKWDEELIGDDRNRWYGWIEDLKTTGVVEINRCVYHNLTQEVKHCSLHGFADASKKAYSAMIYLLCVTDEGVKVSLLTSKTRVVPLKELSIPRLELMSARILVTLMNTVKQAVKHEIDVSETKYWLDSLTALYWIQNRGEWKQFVKHRVTEILSLSDKSEWGHCPGSDNPADIGSRGANMSELKNNQLWWEGPEWLVKSSSEWPQRKLTDKPEETQDEERKVASMLVSAQGAQDISAVIEISKYSTMRKLLRITAWIKRFINNLKRKLSGSDLSHGELTPDEVSAAEVDWIKSVQGGLKQQGNFSQLERNFGVHSSNEILRCKGRMCNSDLDAEAYNPILLAKAHRFTELLVLDCHKRVHHTGVRATLAELRSRYWVPKGRQLVKKIVGKCVICKKVEGVSYASPPISDLPEFRVQRAEPFDRTGVDFAGPLYVQDRSDTKKAYITLFTCCVTRAIHLELVSDLFTDTFLRGLRRFTSRRGTPSLMISDNGTTFVAADKALKELYDHPEVKDHLEVNRIVWKFNLARAPWWGGFFERMVRSVKGCLKKVVGSAKLSFDELSTVLVEIEGTLNARPLTYEYNEVEAQVLTPGHLMFGRRISSIPDHTLDEEAYNSENVSDRFRFVTIRLEHFWNRWKKEYLCDLREQHRSRKRGGGREVEVGDVVNVFDDKTKRNVWKMGIVEKLIIGKDNITRGAKVRVLTNGKPKIFSRPIQHLFPIEVKAEVKPSKDTHVVAHKQVSDRPKRKSALEAKDKIKAILLET